MRVSKLCDFAILEVLNNIIYAIFIYVFGCVHPLFVTGKHLITPMGLQRLLNG